LVSANDQEHMARFLRQLRDHGFHPRVVITDGSGLYPALLAALWPHAEHQLCVFHIVQDITSEVLEAVKRLRRQQRRQGQAWQKRRGRSGSRRSRSRRLTGKEKAHFVFKHRYLIVKRPEHLTQGQRQDLQRMLDYLPALRELRRFMEQVYLMLAAAQTEAQAWARYESWCADAGFRAVPELAAVVAGMTGAKFRKVVAFLRSPVGQRVRTNNHVERLNRHIRHYEAVRYGWRTGRGIARFVVLLVERCWRSRQAAEGPRLYRPGCGAEPTSRPATEPTEPQGPGRGEITGQAMAG
jgi:transposase